MSLRNHDRGLIFHLLKKTFTFKKYKMRILLISILIIVLISCSKSTTADPTPVCSGPAKTYSADVSNLLRTSCNDDSGSHGSGSSNGPGELISFQKVFNARSVIGSAISSGRMPLNGNLTAEQKNAILCWIDNGSPDN